MKKKRKKEEKEKKHKNLSFLLYQHKNTRPLDLYESSPWG